MRYLQYLVRSPRLALQLSLMLTLACLIGGTGLAGLQLARHAITNTSTTRMPALVHLLDVERDIEEANYDGLDSVLNPNPNQRNMADLPKIRALGAQTKASFALFQAANPPTAATAALLTRVSQLLDRWEALCALSQQLTPSVSTATIIVALKAADAAIVLPLRQALEQLVQATEAQVTAAGTAAAASAQTTSVLLLAVIGLAVLAIGSVQIGLAVREHRRRALSQQSADLVALVDGQGVVRYASPSYERVLGHSGAALAGASLLDFLHPDDRADAAAALERRREDRGDSTETELRVRHADGTYRWLASTGVNLLHDPLIQGIIITSRDIGARRETEAALAFQAGHDPLTGLPNRTLLLERLKHALATTVGTPVALLLVDLDRFKDVNDTLGHHAGDLLLQQVGGRLRAAVRGDDVVARLGGDEYALLLPNADETAARQLADRLVEALEAPFQVVDQTLEIGASIGVAIAPQHGRGPHTLLQHADVAMYQAKHDHLRVTVYDPDQDQHSLEGLALLRDLRLAILESQVTLHYQPKVEIATRQVCGVEALLRWPHPTRGLIPPDQFIPTAEQTGLIEPLTAWVLDTALRQCRAWQDEGLFLPVAVNMSPRVLQDQQLPDRLSRLLQRHGVSPSRLTLEITESSLMANPERVHGILTSLHRLGVTLSIDDFGTGYSSLAYLKELPVQELKIDKSFVLGMGDAGDTQDAAIVRSVVAMAHELHLTVVAEGVEDAQALAVLTDIGCDTIQGYYACRPVPPAELAHWLQSVAPQLVGGGTREDAMVTEDRRARTGSVHRRSQVECEVAR